MAVPYTLTATSLTLVVEFRPTVIPSSHPNFKELSRLAKLKNTTEADVKKLLDIPTAISNYTDGEISVINGRLYYRGSEVKNNLATIILGFVKSGDAEAAEPFKKFLANCRRNPDLALVDTIYDWCIKGGLPITPDGELLAWKIVQPDYKSIHSGPRGKLDHSIGATVTEPREELDPDRNRTCSRGIHFASLEYIEKGHYGTSERNRIVAVVVNPEDITAIPTDYNLSKGRCCKLRVVGEVERTKVRDFYGSQKVYSGWGANPVPAPAPKASSYSADKVKVGQVWKQRDGRLATITDIKDNVLTLDINSGGCWKDTGEGSSTGARREFDLMELVSTPAHTPHTRFPIEVGDVWRDDEGNMVTVKCKSGSGTSATAVLSNGRCVFLDDGSTHRIKRHKAGSLVELIKARTLTKADFKKGQVWKQRDGRLATVLGIDAGYVEVDLDTAGRHYSGRRMSGDHQHDLVELVSEAKPYVRFPVRDGDVWLTRDGRIVDVRKSDGERDLINLYEAGRCICAKYRCNGQEYSSDTLAARNQTGTDLVELITEGLQAQRNPAGFAVGQVWLTRNSQRRTIASISKSLGYTIADMDGALYTASGRFNSDATTSVFDLVKLVKDVA